MSGKRRGSGGPGRGGRDGLPPRKDPREARAEEGLGGHWTQLRLRASVTIQAALTGQNADLQSEVNQSWRYLSNVPRDNHESDIDVMTRLLALFLDRFGPAHRSGDMHPIEALHWMTHNHWNLEDAVADAIRGTDSDLGSSDGLEDLEEEIVPPAINRLNPDVDRESAVKGQRTPAKLTISLRLPENKGTKVLRFNKYDKGAQMDWSNPDHIRELNRWRSQQFRRDLGSVRDARAPFHTYERDWLVELYRSYQRCFDQQGQAHDWRSLRWNDITDDFNFLFGGQILERGGQPRPYRSKPSVMTEHYRIPEICKTAGLTLKEERKANRPESGEEEEEDKSDEGEDGENADTGASKGKKPAKRGGRGGKNG